MAFLVVVAVTVLIALFAGLRVVKQHERGVVFRFARVHHVVRQPGVTLLLPVRDRMRKIDIRPVTLPVPLQEGVTSDEATVCVDAAVRFRVVDPVAATTSVSDYSLAMTQLARVALREVIGGSEAAALLCGHEALRRRLEEILSGPATSWGLHLERIEIKDVTLVH